MKIMNLYKNAASLLIIGAILFSAAGVSAAGKSSASAAPPQISAQSAVVMDQKTLTVFYDKGMHAKMYPASITKIMTGLLVGEKGNANDIVTVGDDIGKSQGRSVSNIALRPGEQLSQDSLMYMMFLVSANDAAYALAENIGGTTDNFVSMMNSRAKELGAEDTHFNNPNGLPDKNNYTTAYDMALIARQAVQTPETLKYFGAVNYTLPADNLRAETTKYGTLVNMLRPNSKYYYNGIIAAKSGWIAMSGYTLVTVAQRDGRTLICVQMKGDGWSSIYRDAKSLLDYGFAKPAPPETSAASGAVKQAAASVSSAISNPGKIKTDPVKKGNPLLVTIAISCFVIFGTVSLAAGYYRSIERHKRRASEDNAE